MKTRALPVIFSLFGLSILSPVVAQSVDNTEVYRVNRRLSANSGMKLDIPNVPVESVEAVVRRESGTTDTFVNLRFEGSETFENGRRAQVDWSNSRPIVWNLDGARPEGRPLVLNAYNGNVHVDEIRVRFREPLHARARYYDDIDRSYRDDEVSDASALRYCRERANRRPDIEVNRVRTGGDLFSSRYTVEGTVSGSCIEEVGYFENGSLKERISMPLDDRFRRNDFSVRVRSGRDGEIRVYTVDGNEERISVDDAIRERG